MDDLDEFLLYNPVDGFDFRVVKPTLEQKTWLVNQVLQKVESASALSKKYHIKRKHLNGMVRQVSKGHSLHLSRGRPLALDEHSHSSIIESISSRACCTLESLKQSINSGFQETLTRNNPELFVELLDDEADLELSQRSMNRYILKFHPGEFPTTCF